jgi:hypothetical protein
MRGHAEVGDAQQRAEIQPSDVQKRETDGAGKKALAVQVQHDARILSLTEIEHSPDAEFCRDHRRRMEKGFVFHALQDAERVRLRP